MRLHITEKTVQKHVQSIIQKVTVMYTDSSELAERSQDASVSDIRVAVREEQRWRFVC
jgi:DNA-binding NarL/FixJ family response regulator